MPRRTIVRTTAHNAQQKYTRDGLLLHRINTHGRTEAKRWLDEHPLQYKYWFSYLNARRETDPDRFIQSILTWLQKTTEVEPVKGRHRGHRGTIITALVVGLKEHPEDPKLHSHLMMLSEDPISYRVRKQFYTAGICETTTYDPRQDGMNYALDHHYLVDTARFFQPTTKRHQNFTRDQLVRMSLHHRLGLTTSQLPPTRIRVLDTYPTTEENNGK
jgi:hypothetical protein